MIDPKSLMARIAKAVQDLNGATERYKGALSDMRTKALEFAEAEALYKKVRYTAELEHDGPAHERRARGETASAAAFNAYRRAEVLYEAAREGCWLAKHEVENARAVLSAVQTASALVRAEADAMRHQT